MHNALLVDEIVRRIAEHLPDLSEKTSCLAFSLCCRALNDPVLDVLWNWQQDLVTLFKVLPPDLWEVNNTVGLVSINRQSVGWLMALTRMWSHTTAIPTFTNPRRVESVPGVCPAYDSFICASK